MKIVSQLNAQGYFVASVEADESPLEPGVFLIPGGAIDVEPPTLPQGKAALWQGDAWVFVNPPDEAQQETPPVNGVPQVVTRFQARAALHLAGLLPQVEALMADAATPMLSRLAWTDAQEFRRQSPTVLTMAVALGLNDQQIDNLFTTAAGIEA